MAKCIPRFFVSLLLFSLLGYALALPVRRADQSAAALEIPDLLKCALGLSSSNHLSPPSNVGNLGLNLPAGINLQPIQAAAIQRLQQVVPDLVPQVVNIVEELTKTVTESLLPNINTILDRLLDGILENVAHPDHQILGTVLNIATDALNGIQSLLSNVIGGAGNGVLPVGNILGGGLEL